MLGLQAQQMDLVLLDQQWLLSQSFHYQWTYHQQCHWRVLQKYIKHWITLRQHPLFCLDKDIYSKSWFFILVSDTGSCSTKASSQVKFTQDTFFIKELVKVNQKMRCIPKSCIQNKGNLQSPIEGYTELILVAALDLLVRVQVGP